MLLQRLAAGLLRAELGTAACGHLVGETLGVLVCRHDDGLTAGGIGDCLTSVRLNIRGHEWFKVSCVLIAGIAKFTCVLVPAQRLTYSGICMIVCPIFD